MQKTRSKYLLPSDGRAQNGNGHSPVLHVERVDPFEKTHTLFFLTRFFIKNLSVWVVLLGVQTGINLLFIYFSPTYFEAYCTILPNDFSQDLPFKGMVYTSPTASRFIAFSKSDAVQEPAIALLMQHDKLGMGKASEILNKRLTIQMGDEGEITVSYKHQDEAFAKEMVQLIIQNCNKVNQSINQKNFEPSYRFAKNRIQELENEIAELPISNTTYDLAYKKTLLNELSISRQKVSSYENGKNSGIHDTYYTLNKLTVDELDKYKLANLVMLNIFIFLGTVYLAAIYQSSHLRVKSFWKLVLKA